MQYHTKLLRSVHARVTNTNAALQLRWWSGYGIWTWDMDYEVECIESGDYCEFVKYVRMQ